MDGYVLGHRRMAPLLEAAREFDIAGNPAPVALYESGSAGFYIWCTPWDNPGGLWTRVTMDGGAYSKPCAFLASVCWLWSEGDRPGIEGIGLTTEAYVLKDAGLISRKNMVNRPDDVAWARNKIEWLWQASKVTGTILPIRVVNE